MKGYQALAEAIVAEETEVLFGLMGDGNMDLVNELVHRHGIRFVAARHEEAAVTMADGFSRASGRLGVCTVTHGPGLSNTATGLISARINRSRIVLVAGDTPIGNRFHTQEMDQAAFSLATAGAFHPLHSGRTMAADVGAAFRYARLGLGPAVLNCPTDILGVDVGEPDYKPSTRTLATVQRLAPDPERVAAVAALAAEAVRPVILAGRGAVDSDAGPALCALGERLGAVLVHTLPARGIYGGHPLDLGLAGGFTSPVRRRLLEQADLVLAFGAGLNQFTMAGGGLFGTARIVQVDIDPARIGLQTAIYDGVIGDAAATSVLLLEAIGRRGPGRPCWAGGELATARSAPTLEISDPVADTEGLDPRLVAMAFNEALPRPRLVAIGLGHFLGFTAMAMEVDDPRDLVLVWQLGSIGRALAAGLGAAVARPDRVAVIFEGDGSLMMSLQELETAVRCAIPVIVVVLDDRAYGAEYHKLPEHGFPSDLAEFKNPDFAAVARGLGLEAHSVKTVADIRNVVAGIGRPQHPVLIHVPISRQVVNRDVFAGSAAASRDAEGLRR